VWGLTQLVVRWQAARQRSDGPALAAAAVLLCVVPVGAFAAATYQRNAVWRTEESLWRDTTAKSPANGRGLMNYGLALMRKGDFAGAKGYFDRALVFTPNYATLEVNLAIVTDRLGQADVAKAHFTRALELEPGNPDPHFFYARWLNEQGETVEAIAHLRRALELSPSDMDPRHLLLETYAKAGQIDALKTVVADTLRLAPDDVEAKSFVNERGEVVVPVAMATRLAS